MHSLAFTIIFSIQGNSCSSGITNLFRSLKSIRKRDIQPSSLLNTNVTGAANGKLVSSIKLDFN